VQYSFHKRRIAGGIGADDRYWEALEEGAFELPRCAAGKRWMSLVNEAVRQIRGTSTNQVPGAALSLMTGEPGDPVVSTALLGSTETV
jgi:hypothetical protein